MRRGRWTGGLTCGPLAALAAILLAAGTAAAQEEVRIRRSLSADAYVKIWSGAGSVSVEGWEQDSLSVTAVRTSEGGRFFQSVADSLAKFGFHTRSGASDQVRGSLRVRVPASSTVWIKAAGAEVRVTGLERGLDVFTVTGPVTVRGSPESVYVESMAGAIQLYGDSSRVVRVKGGRGDVAVSGRVDDLAVRTVDGSIDVSGSIRQRAALEAIEGGITVRGALGRGASLAVDTHSGDVDLAFPPGLSAALDLASVEGRIAYGMGGTPPSSEGSFPGDRLVMETGTGEAEIEVRSFSGTIRVHPEDGAREQR